MKSAVIVFPGSNRDGDVVRALRQAGSDVQKVWHAEHDLPKGTDLVVLPGGFASNLEYLDHLMGKLVDAIDDLGLKQRTVIVFIGDNGTGGDGKNTITELGCRVPLIIRGGPVKAGVVSKELVSAADIFPTIAEYSAAKTPADHKIDGVSLAPDLKAGRPATANVESHGRASDTSDHGLAH